MELKDVAMKIVMENDIYAAIDWVEAMRNDLLELGAYGVDVEATMKSINELRKVLQEIKREMISMGEISEGL